MLLALIFGFSAAAHLVAMLTGLLLAAALMLYLAEGRRAYLPTLLLTWLVGAFVLLFASYSFHPDAFSYVLSSGAALVSFSPADARLFLANPRYLGLTLATACALAIWATNRRSRYFGNTIPLAIAALLFLLVTTGVESPALALGAALPAGLCRRRLCRCLRDPPTQALFPSLPRPSPASQAALTLASPAGFHPLSASPKDIFGSTKSSVLFW